LRYTHPSEGNETLVRGAAGNLLTLPEALDDKIDVGARKGEVVDDAPVRTDDLHAVVRTVGEWGEAAGGARGEGV
jgi:hypothetical protein